MLESIVICFTWAHSMQAIDVCYYLLGEGWQGNCIWKVWEIDRKLLTYHFVNLVIDFSSTKMTKWYLIWTSIDWRVKHSENRSLLLQPTNSSIDHGNLLKKLFDLTWMSGFWHISQSDGGKIYISSYLWSGFHYWTIIILE